MAGASPLVVAGRSSLLRLVRRGNGATEWSFSAAPSAVTTAAASTQSSTGSKSSASAGPSCIAAATAPSMRFDHSAQTGQCVGTLRWSESDAFPPLAPWPSTAGRPYPPPVLTNWRDYLEMRLPPDTTGAIRVQPPMLDGLSYALTLIYALQTLRFRPPPSGRLTVLMVGASSKAEERLMRDSTYWLELCHFWPQLEVELVFVGPEIAPSAHGRASAHGRLRSRCFHGTLGELFRHEPAHDPSSTVVVGFNTGMGNASAGMAKGGFALMQSWLPDLIAILRGGFVSVFTCANDYSDLRGEIAIWTELLQAEVVLPPRRSPFKAATVVRESDQPVSPPAGGRRPARSRTYHIWHAHRARMHLAMCIRHAPVPRTDPSCCTDVRPGVRVVVLLVLRLRALRSHGRRATTPDAPRCRPIRGAGHQAQEAREAPRTHPDDLPGAVTSSVTNAVTSSVTSSVTMVPSHKD